MSIFTYHLEALLKQNKSRIEPILVNYPAYIVKFVTFENFAYLTCCYRDKGQG